jgi:hypothetical protein
MRTLSFGFVGDRPVFMDERTDSYFTLDAQAEDRLHCLLDRAQPLMSAEILGKRDIGDEPSELRHASYASPAGSLLDQHASGARLTDVVKAIALVRSTRIQLRTKPIEILLRRMLASARDAPIAAASRDEMIVHTRRFLSARKLVPVQQNCLLDSLSLLRWLGPRRNAAALLFGVKLDPFAAHCWIQSGDLILNDRVEAIAAFSPVRVIECSQATP